MAEAISKKEERASVGGRVYRPTDLVTWERRDCDAQVLMVTNLWPTEIHPTRGVFVRRQVDSLIKAGLRCDVLFIRGSRSPLAYVLGAALLFRLSLSARKYRIVHAHGGECCLAARFFVRAPLLVSFLGSDLLGRPDEHGRVRPVEKLRRTFIRSLSLLCQATITKSEEMERTLPERLREPGTGESAARNWVIPNGVDREVFRPLDRAQARRELGWPPAEPVALFVARPQVRRKRYALAQETCERARAHLPGLRLHLADRTPPLEMPRLMSAADCLLLTSSIEGSPNVVKEALACNLPVVATAVGDVPNLVKGVDPSAVCDADARALSEGIHRCVGKRSNGRVVTQHLANEAIVDRILAVYETLGCARQPTAQA